jgi:Polyketide synthase modules and related proteins
MVMRGGYYLKQDISHFWRSIFPDKCNWGEGTSASYTQELYVTDCARLWTPNRGSCLSVCTKLWRAVSRAASGMFPVADVQSSAGIRLDSIRGTNTSVYTSAFNMDYDQLLKCDPENLPVYQSTGNAPSILSNRISHFFDLRGPSVTIDTACSSSLVALNTACNVYVPVNLNKQL